MTENYHIDGDIACGGDSTVGKNLKVQGDSTLKGDVKIEGWLDATNIKTPCKGLFSTSDELKKAYPNPMEGWYALVGENIPATIYKVSGGEWIATSGTGGEVIVDGADKTFVAELSGKVDELETNVSAIDTRTSQISEAFTTQIGSVREELATGISDVNSSIATNTARINAMQTAMDNRDVIYNSRIANAERNADYAQRSINVLQDFVSFFPPPFVKVSFPANLINFGDASNINKICYNSLTSTFVAEDVRGNYFSMWSLCLLYGANSNSNGVLPTLGKLYFETDSCKYYRMGATELEPVD